MHIKTKEGSPRTPFFYVLLPYSDLHPIDEWNEEYGEDEDDDVHGQTHFDEVGKLVSADTLNDKVRLIANRRRESRTCGKTDADDERHGVEPHVLGN